MSMMLLLEAAVRSLIMGWIIWLAMRVFCIRQARAQRAAWLLALGGALFMPLLAGLQIGPRVLPTPTAVQSPVQPLLIQAGNSAHEVGVRQVGVRQVGTAGATQAAGYAAGVYIAVAGLLVLRLVVGMSLALRIRRRARRIDCSLDPRLDVRVGERLAAPVTIGSSVVLPKGFERWPPDTLRVVLSHESAHVRHGDFYVQLLAGLHCALFWFSPFSWWLRRQLSDLGEALSDHAALQHAESRASYAEILLAFAGGCSGLTVPAAGVAMARSSNLTVRIERLLSERGFQQCFARGRAAVFIAAAVAVAALAAATSVARVQAAAMHGFVNSDEAYAAPDAETTPQAASAENGAAAPPLPEFPPAPAAPAAPPPPAPHAAATADAADAPMRDLVRAEQELAREAAALGREKFALLDEAAPQIRPESLVELQSKLARIQGRLAAAQGQVEAAIRRQAAVLRSLSEQQSRLGREMGRLSEQQRRLIDQTRHTGASAD